MLLIIHLYITFYVLTLYLSVFIAELLQDGESSLTLVEFLFGLLWTLTPVFNAIILVASLEGIIDGLRVQLKKIKFKQT